MLLVERCLKISISYLNNENVWQILNDLSLGQIKGWILSMYCMPEWITEQYFWADTVKDDQYFKVV